MLLVAESASDFLQTEFSIGKMAIGEIHTHFLQQPVECHAMRLQAPLQCTRRSMQVIGDSGHANLPDR